MDRVFYFVRWHREFFFRSLGNFSCEELGLLSLAKAGSMVPFCCLFYFDLLNGSFFIMAYLNGSFFVMAHLNRSLCLSWHVSFVTVMGYKSQSAL